MQIVVRGCFVAIILVALALPAAVQAQMPTLDGVVTPGEYAHTSGNWSMTWDETHLYVAKSSADAVTIVYLDTDPLSTPTGGSVAHGNISGHPDTASGSPTFGQILPFRADARIRIDGSRSLRTRDGSGGWTNESTSATDVDSASAGDVREVRIRWAAIPGLTGRPAAFRWLGFDLLTGSTLPVPDDAAPSANTGAISYFFDVADSGSNANPFGTRQSSWRVSSEASTGAGSLREAIESANADLQSTRRFLWFDLVNTTIQLVAVLPRVSRATTIDATTQSGFAGTPIVVLRASGGLVNNDARRGFILGSQPVTIRGFVFQYLWLAVEGNGGSGHVIAGNYVGTNVAGTEADADFVGGGFVLRNCSGCRIGGAGSADRNVIVLPWEPQEPPVWMDFCTNPQVSNNYIGTNAAGTALLGAGSGMAMTSTTGAMVGGFGAGEGNVVRGYLDFANSTNASVYGNRFGLGADGVASLGPVGGVALYDSSVRVGGIGNGEANVFANLAEAIVVSNNRGGGHIRGNSIYNTTTPVYENETVTQPAPVIASAVRSYPGVLSVTFSVAATTFPTPTQSLLVDLYDGSGTRAYRATSPCYTGASLTNQTWTVGTAFAAGAQIALMATAYADATCGTPAAGTSKPSDNATITQGKAVTTTALSSNGSGLVRRNASITYTATITSEAGAVNGGQVTFTTNGAPITGCSGISVSGNQAGCVTSATAVGNGASVVATYSGDTTNAGSASSAFVQYYVDRIFTGPGNFSDASRWSNGAVPLNNESIGIIGSCTFDSVLPYRYVQTYLGNTTQPGSLVFAANPTPFHTERIASLTAGGAIDMTAGGVFRFDKSWDTTKMTFTPGVGTVQVNAPGYEPEASSMVLLPGGNFHTLQIYDNVGTNFVGTVRLSGSLHVGANAYAQLSPWSLTVTGSSTWTGDGQILLWHIEVVRGAALTYERPVPVGLQFGLIVRGSAVVTPHATSSLFSVATSRLLGEGTLSLGRSIGPIDSTDFSSLTIRYTQFAGQTRVVGGTYAGLAIATTSPAVLDGNVSTGTLSLESGALTTADRTLTVTSSAAGAVTSTGGWVNGSLTRAVAAGTQTYLFPVGLPAGSAPVSLTVTDVTVPGQMSVVAFDESTAASSFADGGIDVSRNASLFWRVDNRTATFATYTPSFTFGGYVDAGGVPSAFVFNRSHENTSSAWERVPSVLSGMSGTLSPVAAPPATFRSFIAGNQLIASYAVATTASPSRGKPFEVTATARDLFGEAVRGNAATTATFSGSSGDVSFDADANGVFGDAAKSVSDGVATVAVKSTAAGTFTVSVTDGNGKSGTSGPITVGIAATTTTIASSANPSTTGQSVTFIAAVTSEGAGTIAGTVTFRDGGTVLATSSLSGGTVSFTTQSLTQGSHSITATYNGGVDFSGSASTVLTQTVNLAPFGAPGGLSATATSPTTVAVSWMPVSGATAYEIYRATTVGAWALIASTPGTAITDGVTANMTWLYAVRAISGSTPSALSLTDAATTVTFTDASLSGASVKAVHLVELRTAVNAMRAAAALSPSTYTDSPAAGVTIRAVHITELRSALDAARTAIGLAAISYSDPTVTAATTAVKAAHLTELRAGTQ